MSREYDCLGFGWKLGFKGSRNPRHIRSDAGEQVPRAHGHGMRTVEVEVTGPVSGREQPCARCRPWLAGDIHSDVDTHSAQWLPPTKAPPL